MRKLIVDTWNSVMNYHHNPLRHINDLQTRHVVMQILAWMWCMVFAASVGSITVFGISAIAHALLIGAVVVTVATFETAKRKPEFFSRYTYGSTYGGRGNGGEHE